MHTYYVYMLAHMNGETREVNVDFEPGKSYSIADTLEAIFMNGQNDFQPVEGMCSVSVGDIIELCPLQDYYRVDAVGFTRLTYRELRHAIIKHAIGSPIAKMG